MRLSSQTSVADSFSSLVVDEGSDLTLKDGSRVAVIGGGPAGSFFTFFLLKMAEAIDLDIEVDIYEPRSFRRCGPAGCNHCGGIVSESLVQILAAEGINLPPEVVQRGIESYVVHMDVGSVAIQSPVGRAAHRRAVPGQRPARGRRQPVGQLRRLPAGHGHRAGRPDRPPAHHRRRVARRSPVAHGSRRRGRGLRPGDRGQRCEQQLPQAAGRPPGRRSSRRRRPAPTSASSARRPRKCSGCSATRCTCSC